MIPDHVLYEKALDAAHKARPGATLDELDETADDKVAAVKAKCTPPPRKPQAPAEPAK